MFGFTLSGVGSGENWARASFSYTKTHTSIGWSCERHMTSTHLLDGCSEFSALILEISG